MIPIALECSIAGVEAHVRRPPTLPRGTIVVDNENQAGTEAPETKAAATEPAAAPVRKRASRRVTAPAGEAVAPAEAPAAAPAEAAAPEVASAEEAPKKRVSRSRKKAEAPAADAADAAAEAAETPATAAAPAAEAPAADAVEEAPKKRVSRSRKKAEVETPAEPAEAAAAEAKTEAAAEAPAADAAAAAAEAAPAKRTRRARTTKAEAPVAEAPAADAAEASAQTDVKADVKADAKADVKEATEAPVAAKDAAKEEAPARGRRSGRAVKDATKEEAKDAAEAPAESKDAATTEAPAEAEATETNGRRTRNRRGQKAEGDAKNESKNDSKSDAKNGEQGEQRNGPATGNDNNKNEARSSRTRQRDRKRRGQGDDLEPEITEDDVLLPIAGVLDILDNYAFVRTSGYLPGTSDVYVSLGQVKKYGMNRGDAIVGAIRQPREGEQAGRQKYNAIVKVDSVNGRTLEENEKRVSLEELAAIYPDRQLKLANGAGLGQQIDKTAPIGFGQRSLVVLPKHTRGVEVLSQFAVALATTAPDAHVMLVLANAQPEDVTHLERNINGEVIAATFERSAEDQATIAELSIERAKRLAELGHDVVVLMDSMVDFARAFAQSQPVSARPGRGEIDDYSLQQVRRVLGAARNVENSGSLTVIATAAKSGHAGDKELVGELRVVANSEIRLEADGKGKLKVDADRSRTRGAALLGSAAKA